MPVARPGRQADQVPRLRLHLAGLVNGYIGCCGAVLRTAAAARVLLTMSGMHHSTASRLVCRPGAAATGAGLWLLVSPAVMAAETAAAAPPGSPLGPWIFASVAFVVVAAASYAAGLWRSASQRGQHTQHGQRGQAHPQRGTAPETGLSGPASAPSAARLAPLYRLAVGLAADPRPLVLLEIDRLSGERLLAHANATALRQLGATPQALGQPWSAVEAAAPAALRHALTEPGNPGGWWLLRDEGGSLCLALGPDSDGGEAETASLVYTVSHDLRAPIRVVEGFTRIVKEDYGRQLDRVGNDHLDRVLAAGARMNQMIDAVLTMARLASQPLARQPVDLSQLAAFVLDDLRRSAPERPIEIEIEPGLRARGDPTLLRLVLENLLGNAWKYSSHIPHSRIEFSATRDGGDTGTNGSPYANANPNGSPTTSPISNPGSSRCVFAVRDNGAGFDMRVADRLFGLFQRLHSAKDFPGTGVGLASVRRIVQRHGGEVWAESEPGRGATFFFTLAD